MALPNMFAPEFSMRTHASSPLRTLAHRLRRAAVLGLPALSVAACGGGGGGGSDMIGKAGQELAKPGGTATFFVDKNQGGGASFLRIEDIAWGRLVDVHDIDEASGDVDPTPVFRDFVINETIQTDGSNYILETNPVTQKTRLVVLREKKDDETDEFTGLLKLAGDDLSPVLAKSDAPGVLPPFSFVARNAALVVRFNDLLQDDDASLLQLTSHVKVLTNYPPSQPYVNMRSFFDPNHGGLSDGGSAFHSTRIIIDTTVSEAEATTMVVPTGLNSLGLPASLVTSESPNVAIRIPSRIAPAIGQFSILTNLAGHGVATSDHGPVDFSVDTVDVVRAMRAGNDTDQNNGFLVDLNPPQLLSGWPVTVTGATDNPAGTLGFDFFVDLVFTSPCRAQPEAGNIIELPGLFAEVATLGLPPDFSGVVPDVEVRLLTEDPVAPSSLLGGGLFKRTYDPSLLPSQEACWVSFAPQPGIFPDQRISPNSQVVVRFSEPMDPATITPFDTFMVKRTPDEVPSPLDLVVGDVLPSGDIKEYTFTPLVPFNHLLGSTEEFFIDLVREDGITDLAGNAPPALPADISFFLDPEAPTFANGGLVMRFSALDEVVHPETNPMGAEDFTGQFLIDLDRGLIKPRPVIRSAAIADRTQTLIGLMSPFAPGVQTPLSPLGSKMMTVWRYADVGFSSTDLTTYNMDVEGLNWSPIGAQIVSDFYPEFEMRLSHSHYLPDEAVDQSGSLLPFYNNSGLKASSFTINILDDPDDPEDQKVVHPRGLGYVVNPVNLFLTPTNTFMFPFPFNTGSDDPEDHVYYTWRDTSILTKAAPQGGGIDMRSMELAGLIPPMSFGDIAPPGQVPTIGLPLLMEFRCYPAESGVGLNAFDISLALNQSRLPAFRVFSTGGTNTASQVVIKDPDLETQPTGGFNPSTNPPGGITPPDDPIFYIGQMDLITRISRVHTIWLDTRATGPNTDFLQPVLEPTPDLQPSGTEMIFAYRGAQDIDGPSLEEGWAFDAANIDPYGDIRDADDFIGLESSSDVTYLGGSDWKNNLDELDTARFFQIRVTFVGNTTTLLTPELSAIGVAWTLD